MKRNEDQLTAAFLSTLRLCPKFSRALLKKFLGRTFDTTNGIFDFQVHENSECKPDGIIEYPSQGVIYIENKITAILSAEQIDKYKKIAYYDPNNIIWFIYENEPKELASYRFRFKKTQWSHIHRFLHLFSKSSNEAGILNEFEDYLRGIGMGSFDGFEKDDANVWVRSAEVRENMKKYLIEFIENRNRLEDILENFECSDKPSMQFNGQDIYITIWKTKKKGIVWKKRCKIYIGFWDGTSDYDDWNDGQPFAYIRAEILKSEWMRICNRKEKCAFRSSTRGLKLGNFNPEKERRSEWTYFVSKIYLQDIEKKRNQKEILDKFFLVGLRVLENNIFHEIERYPKR